MECGRIVTTFSWPLRRTRIFLPRSPRSMNNQGGELMMIVTLLIGTASLAAMVTGFVVMIRD